MYYFRDMTMEGFRQAYELKFHQKRILFYILISTKNGLSSARVIIISISSAKYYLLRQYFMNVVRTKIFRAALLYFIT